MSNAGDEAILEAILAEMRSIDPDMPISVLSRTPQATAEKHGVKALHMFDLPGFLKVMRRSRLYINGGGSLIQDVTSSRSLWYYLYTLVAARHRGCKVLMYGCGIGPVRRGFNRQLTRRILDRYVDTITLREEHSLEELRSFGVKRPKVIVASDPALSLSPAPAEEVDAVMARHNLGGENKYICFCLRSWNGFSGKAKLFGAAADYAYEKYGLYPVFLSVNHRKDGLASDLAVEDIRAPYTVIYEPMSTRTTAGFLSRMQVVMSMRLHGLIFAASQSVALAGVSYDPKVAAFLDYIGQDNYVDFGSFTGEDLERLIDRAVQADPAELAAATERIKAIESRNTQAARELLGK